MGLGYKDILILVCFVCLYHISFFDFELHLSRNFREWSIYQKSSAAKVRTFQLHNKGYQSSCIRVKALFWCSNRSANIWPWRAIKPKTNNLSPLFICNMSFLHRYIGCATRLCTYFMQNKAGRRFRSRTEIELQHRNIAGDRYSDIVQKSIRGT